MRKEREGGQFPCEKPEPRAPRRLSDHLMFEGQKQKVHSLVDKVYSRKNLKLAWERVRANRGASGIDQVTIEDFEANLDENLERLHQDLRDQTYQPQAVLRWKSPRRGLQARRDLRHSVGPRRTCQQALANRLDPISRRFRPEQLWISQRPQDGRRASQDLARTGGRK